MIHVIKIVITSIQDYKIIYLRARVLKRISRVSLGRVRGAAAGALLARALAPRRAGVSDNENYASSLWRFFSRVLGVNEQKRGNAGLGPPPPSPTATATAAAAAVVHSGVAEHAPRNCVSRGRRPEISSALPTYTRENDGTRTTVEKERGASVRRGGRAGTG